MTVPIIPGPGSFLEQLGQTGAQLINAHTQGQVATRDLASRQLSPIMNLISAGVISRDVLAHPEIQQLMSASGMTPVGSSDLIPDPGEAMKRLQAGILADPNDPRGETITGIPDKATATQQKDLRNKKMGVESKQIDVEGQQADLDKQIFQGISKQLETNPAFRKMSYAARMGTLSYLVQELQNQGSETVARINANTQLKGQEKALRSDRFNSIRQLYQAATAQFQTEYTKWAQMAQLHEGDDKWLNSNPPPTFEGIFDAVKKGAGISDDDFHKAFSDMLEGTGHTTAGPDKTGSSSKAKPKTPQQILGYAQMLMKDPTLLPKLNEAVAADSISSDDADKIKKAAGITK